MRPARPRPGSLRLTLSLGALAAVSVLATLGLASGKARPGVARIRPQPSPSGAVTVGPVVPTFVAAPVASREPAPPVRSALAGPRPDLDRLEKLRLELGQWLRFEPFDRPSFERAVAALARVLTEEQLAALREAPGPDEDLSGRLARLELLAVRARGTYSLSASERVELRTLLSRDPGAAGESAARLLAFLGDGADRALLLETLRASEDLPRARSLRALLAIPVEGEFRGELALLLEAAPATAEFEVLRERLTPPAVPARAPREILRASSASDEERLAAAEQLVRAGEPAPEATVYLIEALTEAAPGTRRRALYALAAGRDPVAAAHLAELARFDPDPATRCAAVRVLAPETERALLEELARHDSAPEVRALAAQRLIVCRE